MIELKEFMKETLIQITDAITEFTEERGDTGANANPPIVEYVDGLVKGQKVEGTQRFDTVIPVDFNVVISAQEKTDKGGKVGIKVLSVLNADGGMNSEFANELASTVSFKIPLRLPDTNAKGNAPKPQPKIAIPNRKSSW